MHFSPFSLVLMAIEWSRVEWGEAGRNLHPTAFRGTNPAGFEGARVSLAVFQAALCQTSTWELYENNVQESCHDPGDWNVFPGKASLALPGTGHSAAVPAAGSEAEPAILCCL